MKKRLTRRPKEFGRAVRWDRFYSDFNLSEYLETLQYDDVTPFLQNTIPTTPQRVLDIGCGPGRHLHLQHQAGQRDLHGIDLNPRSISLARDHLPSVCFAVGDATSLPFPDDTFDLVQMIGIVYEIEDPEGHTKAFQEINRVLKPGGILLFVNNSPYNFGERLFTVTEAFRKFLSPRQEETFFIWRFSRSRIRNLIRKARMTLVSETPCNHNFGVMRFLYGVFVNGSQLRDFRRKIDSGLNPYTLNEYYLSNKDDRYFNMFGKLALRISKALFPFLFANTICYVVRKPDE